MKRNIKRKVSFIFESMTYEGEIRKGIDYGENFGKL